MRLTRVIQALALTLISFATFAQLRETVSVNVVEVPVTVVDSSGNPVRGLKAENFKLIDQGKERAITSFDVIDFATASNDALAPINPAARRNFLLLFDLSNSQPAALGRAQEAARNFVAKAVQPRDLVGVGTIDVEHGFRLLSVFTSDRELIASAIGNPTAFKSADPLQLSNETKLVTLDTSSGIETPAGGAPAGGGKQERMDAIAFESKERMAQIQRANQQYVRGRVEKEVDYLGQLAKMLRAIGGRKQIIFLSEGFDPSVIQGRDARDTAATRAENDDILSGRIGQVDSDARFGSTTSQSFVEKMTQVFRGSDVVLHAIDIQGVRVQNDVQGGARINSNAGLGILASPTGGMVFSNSNNMQDNLARMLRAQEVVYVLAFQSQTTKPGTLHNLSVKLVNVPGGKAFSRSGYYEGGNETVQERTLTNAEIILNDIPQTDIRVASLAAAFPTSSANAQIPVILEIDGADLMRDLKGNAANAEVYLYAFDSDGLVRDRMYQKMGLDLKKVGDKLRGSGIKYYATLALPPGKYAVKALVRIPETERRGFARADLIVPKSTDMSVVPPIFVEEQPKWLMVKGTTHDKTGAAYPFMLNGEMFIPAAAPRVKSGETKRFAVFVHNAKADELTWETNPKVKFLGAATTAGSTAFVMELDKFDPSLASLDVTVHKKGVADAQKASVALR